jgi:hypothetical protein
MPVDFADAAVRHWDDAEALFSDLRLPNADHLYGLAAECALKAVMKALGMPVDSVGKPIGHATHIKTLWNEFSTFAQGHGGASYSTRLPNGSSPFDDWKIDKRYHHRNDFVVGEVHAHQVGARITMDILREAQKDGVVQ